MIATRHPSSPLAPPIPQGRPLCRNTAVVTVFHNGVLVQDHVALKGNTVYTGQPFYEKHGDREPLMLQDHGNPVAYRNVWIREL